MCIFALWVGRCLDALTSESVILSANTMVGHWWSLI